MHAIHEEQERVAAEALTKVPPPPVISFTAADPERTEPYVPVPPPSSLQSESLRVKKPDAKEMLKDAVREAGEKGDWWQGEDDGYKRPKTPVDKLR